MKLRLYLLIDRHGAVEVRKKLPEPRLHQVAVQLLIEIDDKWFTRPVLTAELTIPDDHIQPMATIEAVGMEEEEREG